MSLVDKLDGVHVGDLILLTGKSQIPFVGFVVNYSTEQILLSNALPRYESGKIRNPSGFGFLNGDRLSRENLARFPLSWFEEFEILRKYEPPVKKEDPLSNQ